MKRIDTELALSLHNSGYSLSRIAEVMGVTKRSVERWRSRNQLSQPWHGVVAVPVETLERARLLLEDGASRAEVARTVGVDWRTLKRHFPGMKWSSEEVLEFAHMMQRRSL